MNTPPLLNALTVDVEDWFQVSAFDHVIDRASWGEREWRVERNTASLLDLLGARGVKATFFVLGWVAEKMPGLVQELHARGHEIASHGYEHRLVNRMTPEAFRADLRRAAAAIEAAAPVKVRGFRAPSFSISEDALWAFDVLRDEGYLFSSSVFPVRHDRYGIRSFSRTPVRLVGGDGRAIWEFPMTTWRILGMNLPAAGGGWMRLLPPAVMRRAIASANAEGVPAIVYLHPWEVDPEQPRVTNVSRMARFRHYLNLGRMRGRLSKLLDTFPFGTVTEVLTEWAQAHPEDLEGRAQAHPEAPQWLAKANPEALEGDAKSPVQDGCVSPDALRSAASR